MSVCPHEFLVMPKDWKKRLYLIREVLHCGVCNAELMVGWGEREGMKAELRAMVPGTNYEICVRNTGAVSITTNVQVDRDHLEVGTPEDWASIVELVRFLQAAQSAALATFNDTALEEEKP